MKYLLLFLISVVYLISNNSYGEDCIHLPLALEHAVSRKIEQERGSSDCRSRQVVFGDINIDSKKDTAVSFSIEGACGPKEIEYQAGTCGNHSETYVIALLSNEKEGRATEATRVSSDRDGLYVLEKIENGEVVGRVEKDQGGELVFEKRKVKW